MSYPKLRGAIREKFRTQGAFAKAAGIDPSMLSKKLAGKSEWTSGQIQIAVELLEIPVDSISEYFFRDLVASAQPEIRRATWI